MDEITVQNGTAVIEGASEAEGKVLRIRRERTGAGYSAVLGRLAQYADIACAAAEIEKGKEYVVQIPAKFREAFEKGEVFINESRDTGVQWPTLMRKTDSGQYRFVAHLPVKQRDARQNGVYDACGGFRGLYLHQQVARIAEQVADTYEAVRRIEQGQEDDRLSLIDSGREEILLALSMLEGESRDMHLAMGAHDLLLGRERAGKALKRRAESFKGVPEGRVRQFLMSFLTEGYLSGKDEEVERMDGCYAMYLDATRMLAAVFALKGEPAAAEMAVRKGMEFAGAIDFGEVRTISNSHAGADFSGWFFNRAAERIGDECAAFLEAAHGRGSVEIEAKGEDLLEVIMNG